MKRICLLITVMGLLAMVFFGSSVVFAQESVEQYLLNLTQPTVKDYINLMYNGSHENKLLAAAKLRKLKDKSDKAEDALIFGLQQGTIYVQRKSGKVINDFWDVRTASALALGEIGDPKVLPYLYQAVRYEPDHYVRGAIAIAIGKIGQKDSLPEITRMIETADTSGPDDVLLLACIEAIGNIGDREGFIPLVEIIRGKYRRSIRVAAMETLKKMKF